MPVHVSSSSWQKGRRCSGPTLWPRGARWTYFQWPRTVSRVPQAPQVEELDTKLGQLRRAVLAPPALGPWEWSLWGASTRHVLLQLGVSSVYNMLT